MQSQFATAKREQPRTSLENIWNWASRCCLYAAISASASSFAILSLATFSDARVPDAFVCTSRTRKRNRQADMPTVERAKWHNQAHARRAANVTHFGSCDNLSSLVLSLQELLDASRGLRTNHEARTGQETDEARAAAGAYSQRMRVPSPQPLIPKSTPCYV